MSNFYLISYLLAWVITWITYQRKRHQIDAGSTILISYIGYAVCSIILYNSQVDYYDFNELTLFPFIYLYIMLMIAISPVLKFNNEDCAAIEEPHMPTFKLVSWLIIISTILSIPTFIEAIQEGQFLNLLVDESAGKDMYDESMSSADEAGSGISHIPNIIFNAFSDISIFLFFYYLTLSNRSRLILIGLAISMFAALMSPMLSGLRANTIITGFTIIVAYALLKKYYTDRIRRIAKIIGVVLLFITVLPIVAITSSRYDDGENGAIKSTLYYVGQANLNFNNYGLDNNGIRYGDRTFNLAKRIIDPSTPTNYVERRIKYPNLHMDDNIFYTFIGDFTLDFGPWIAPIIIILFSLFIRIKTRMKEDTITFHQLLLIYLVACICMQGGMYLFAYSDMSGLKFITLFLLYYLFRFLYNIRKTT